MIGGKRKLTVLALTLVLTLVLIIPNLTSALTVDNTGFAYNTNDVAVRQSGLYITVNKTSDLISVNKTSTNVATGADPMVAYLINGTDNTTVLATATFSGDVATFSPPYRLQYGVKYWIVTGANGASMTGRYLSPATFPVSGNNVNYTGGAFRDGYAGTFTFSSNTGWNIVSVTTESGARVEYTSPVNHSLHFVSRSPQVQLNVTVHELGSVLTALYAYLYNSTGLVQTYYSQVASNNHSINLTGLPVGAYYVNSTAYNFTNVTIPDTSGKGNNLTSVRQVVVNSTCGKDGTLGACFTNITNEYLVGASSNTLIQNVTGQTFNISLDFNWRGSSTDTQTLIRLYRSTNQGSTAIALSIDESASQFNVNMVNSTGTGTSTCLLAVVKDTWYSVRVAYNGTTLLCYNNSVFYFSRNTTFSGTSTGQVTIGAQPSATPAINTFNGSVDNVLIENGTGITLNATFDSAYFLNSVLGGVLNFTIYNLTNGSITSPVNGSSVSSQTTNVSWTNTTITPTGLSLTIPTFSLLLFNSDGSFNRSLVNTSSLSYNLDWYAQNLSTGVYRLRVVAWDNQSNSVNYTDVSVNLTTNALLNITAIYTPNNGTLTTFNATIIGGNINQTYGTTTSLIQADIVKGIEYNITIFSSNTTTNNTLYSTNDTFSALQFSLYGLNSLNIQFKDELTNTIINTTTVYLDLISTDYANNYSTNDGTLTIDSLTATTYTARYDATGYTERFYQFTITNDTYQILTLYLLNTSIAQNVTITVIDQNTLPLEGAIVKALKYDITINDYLIVEIGQTDVNGQVVLDLTLADEFYKFIVVYNDETVKITDPSYLYSTSLTIQVIIGEDILDNFESYQDLDYTLYFENLSTNTTVFTYNDRDNLGSQYCLAIYKVRNVTAIQSESLVNYNCSTSSSGSLTLTLTGINEGEVYKAIAYYYTNGQLIPLSQILLTFEEDVDTGTEGLMIQLFFTTVLIVLIILAKWPEAIPAIIPISLVLGRLLNFNEYNQVVLYGLASLGLALSVWISWQKHNRG